MRSLLHDYVCAKLDCFNIIIWSLLKYSGSKNGITLA